MTSDDWDALFIGMPEEVKKWLAFLDFNEGAMHGGDRPKQCSAEGSNEHSSDEKDREEEHDLPIQRVL